MALELAARGLGDAITARGALHRLGDRLDQALGRVSLRPRLWDEFAIVHRRGGQPSPAGRVVVELASARMRSIIGVARTR
ncbi:MAG: LysR substrate-binding domain-containing protein [Jatrophihabitans sp.]